MQVVRRTLFDGETLRIGHVLARPPVVPDELERQDANILVFPLAGVFAKHDGPRRRVIGTPNHAVFIAADRPYRITYPGGVGDRCLTLRVSSDSLAEFRPIALASSGLLPPRAMLTRSLLMRQFEDGEWDPLDVEEAACSLLALALRVLQSGEPQASWRPISKPIEAVEAVKEAICLRPDRKWTLGALAKVANTSPFQLARYFRQHTGTSVYENVLRARLALALDTLLDSDAGLAAVAFEAGFSSHSHFSARFRAFFGMTPSALRKSMSGANAAQIRKILTIVLN